MEPKTKTCGPIPGGFILTHTNIVVLPAKPEKQGVPSKMTRPAPYTAVPCHFSRSQRRAAGQARFFEMVTFCHLRAWGPESERLAL